jgi:phosphomannomutase
VRELAAAGGVCITASHNPPQFNGFKIKAPWGGSAAPETTAAIEALVDAEPIRHTPTASDTIHKNSAPELSACIASYRRAITDYVDIERLRASSSRIAIDSMHGSGGHWIESFLRGGNIKAETIRHTRDPLFGGVNPEPIDLNLGALKQRVRETSALVGLATDGDADRLGAVNDAGETMTMHEVVPLIFLHLARNRGMTGGVVRTFSQSVLTRRIAAAHNLPLYDTPIGFKYIAELMLREDILIGAEESGGIGVRGHIPERDGILNSLLLLEAIVTAGKPPTQMVKELHAEFGEFYFGRIDLHTEVSHGQALVRSLSEQTPATIAGHKVTDVSTMDGTKLLFADESWLLFRQSGTEPALRIYAEATSTNKMRELLEADAKWQSSKQLE